YTVVYSPALTPSFMPSAADETTGSSMDTFTPTAALRQQMAAIEAALNQLADLLGQLELQEAHVYPLPPVPQGEEHDPIEQIEVGYLNGE
ncbi:DNA replication terminus site-binding protein, partial [Escherichia coli]|nr:DNA replication terminus site-binding protein [Escherichia coli]